MTLMAVALAGCGDSGSFSVSGEVLGKPNMNMYVKYYGDGKVISAITLVADGKFEVTGYSRKPTIVEIADNEQHPLAYLILANGQSASVKIDRHNPFNIQATGTPVIEEWARIVSAQADSLFNGSPITINELVEEQIAKAPGSVASALMFVACYDASIDPARADSVAQSLLPEARLNGLLDSYATMSSRYAGGNYIHVIDSIPYRSLKSQTTDYFVPSKHAASLIAITDVDSKRRTFRTDTLLPALRKLAKDDKIEVFDLTLSVDTSSWKSYVRRDSATWTQAWAPGGIYARGIDSLAVPQLPYFIVVDSIGRQRYRGATIDIAVKKTHEIINKQNNMN